MDKLKETFGKVLETVKTKWTEIGRKGHIIFFAVLGVVVASAVIVAILANNTGKAVLYSGASQEEASEILSVIQNDLGTSDVTINGRGDIIVPEDVVEDLRVRLSILGYPKSAFNYNVWDEGIGLFSTETDKQVKQVQQLQENLRATLATYQGVDSAIVILNIPPDDNYVIGSGQVKEASASVVLQTSETLTVPTIEGIYHLVRTAVPGLTEENITVTDGTGVLLTTDEIIVEADKDEIELYYKRLDVQNSITAILKDKLTEIFDGVFPDYRVGVDVQLNYNKEVLQEKEYTPSVDEEGNRGGMVSEENAVSAGGGTAAVGGEVGTAVDADISPDYPTLQVGEGDDIYWEWQRQIKYLVNEEIRQVEKDGYSYDNISATVVVDATGLSQADIESWQSVIATAIGADLNRVSFMAYPFRLEGTSGSSGDGFGDDGTIVVQGERNALIFLIIALGVLLLILLAIALFASSSSKKRAKARRAAAMAMAATAANERDNDTEDDDMKEHGGAYGGEYAEDFEIQSLSGERTETREDVLKREIREFSKTNPEIVAQLIRNWMRGDE
ncbi:MAG: flagellar M-ring protein FliF [Bacteroides sp.]|nr:flagellar M-ring protein FliF [Eubacterium sp.]MCM1418613.1 flagellar M-ring protein FliF [Roseburia sp.]MCM1462667.1 flagellar M-ring protein FliF [Bacteroides sp.]